MKPWHVHPGLGHRLLYCYRVRHTTPHHEPPRLPAGADPLHGRAVRHHRPRRPHHPGAGTMRTAAAACLLVLAASCTAPALTVALLAAAAGVAVPLRV